MFSLMLDTIKAYSERFFEKVDPVQCAALYTTLCFILYIWWEVYVRLRKKFPYKVQCWFCHSFSKVKYTLRNSWICLSCDQYNGFNEDGGYNQDIPQQYKEEYNFSVSSIGRKKDDWFQENSLCHSCNKNQELKVKQLANYVPVNEENFDDEIEHFANLLEKTFKLCWNCEHLISKISQGSNSQGSTLRRLNKIPLKTDVYRKATKLLMFTLVISLILFMTSLVNIVGKPKWLRAAQSHIYLATVPFLKGPIMSKVLKTLDPALCFCFLGGLPSISFTCTLGLFLALLQVTFNKTTSNLLNTGSWVTLTFLSFYPARLGGSYHYILAASGFLSTVANGILLYHQLKKIKRKNEPPLHWSSCVTPPEMATPEPIQRPQRPPSRKPLSTISTPSAKSTPRFVSSQKEGQSEDFGISNLNLGPKEEGLLRNRQTTPKTKCSPIISPPKFKPPKWGQPLSRESSCSSGFSSLNSPDGSLYGGFEGCDRRDLLSRCSLYQPTLCSYSPSIQPIACYHFSAQYPHSFIPPSPSNSTLSLLNQSEREDFLLWKALYTVPMVLLVVSNIVLIWTVYSQTPTLAT